MGRFSHLNPASPENENFWESVKDEVFKLLNEINEQVFNGQGKVEQRGNSWRLGVDRSDHMRSCSLTIRPRANAQELIWEVHAPKYGQFEQYFSPKDLVPELEKATTLILDHLRFL